MIVLMAQSTLAPSKQVQDGVADWVHPPAVRVAAFNWHRVLPAKLLLLLCKKPMGTVLVFREHSARWCLLTLARFVRYRLVVSEDLLLPFIREVLQKFIHVYFFSFN